MSELGTLVYIGESNAPEILFSKLSTEGEFDVLK